MAFISRNPATGERVATFENMSEAQIETALAKAMSAHKTLKSWTMEDRRAAMHRIADMLEAEANELGAIITLEMGKTLKSAIGEVKKCALGCRYYADNAADMMADEVVNATAATTYRKYLPLGPIMVVMPWNYPLWQMSRNARFLLRMSCAARVSPRGLCKIFLSPRIKSETCSVMTACAVRR